MSVTASDLPTRVQPALLDPVALRRVVIASVLGTIIEWYDFLVYSTAAALVFRRLFFPAADPFVGTLAAFGAYAVGFAARPLGGLLFGHYGDRIGRKAMLVTTLLVTGLGTFLVGCLPTYAQVGPWAPVLLIVLRLVQGVGVGGEWGGAVLMVAESAPPARRGLLGALVQVGNPLGRLLATAAFIPLLALPPADLLSWGWRLPFLASAGLVVVGLFIRARVQETPEFARLRAAHRQVKLPAIAVMRDHARALWVSIGLKVGEVAWVGVLTAFSVDYLVRGRGLPERVIVDAVLVAAAVELLVMPLAGWASDRFGRRRLYLIGTLLSIGFAFPVFWMFDSNSPGLVMAAVVIGMTVTQGIIFALHASLMPELFGTGVRYSGVSLGFQVGAALAGGLTPIIATALVGWSGGTWPVSLYLVGVGVLGLWALAAAARLIEAPAR
jgi:MHS family shikimate/dehydroshikimate transporter-like MFS transporter